MTDPEWPHLSDVPRDRDAVVDQVRAAAAVKAHTTILHRMPGTRFAVAATYPDGTPIDFAGASGTILGHCWTTVVSPSLIEEVYVVRSDDPEVPLPTLLSDQAMIDITTPDAYPATAQPVYETAGSSSYRLPASEFSIPATDPDGTPIDEQYVGLRGSIIAHVATIMSPSAAAEEIYAVVYDDLTKAPKFPSTEWWTTSDLPLLSDRWMCTDTDVKTLPDEIRAKFTYPQVQLGVFDDEAYRKSTQDVESDNVLVLEFPGSASLDPLKRTDTPTDDADPRAEI